MCWILQRGLWPSHTSLNTSPLLSLLSLRRHTGRRLWDLLSPYVAHSMAHFLWLCWILSYCLHTYLSTGYCLDSLLCSHTVLLCCCQRHPDSPSWLLAYSPCESSAEPLSHSHGKRHKPGPMLWDSVLPRVRRGGSCQSPSCQSWGVE